MAFTAIPMLAIANCVRPFSTWIQWVLTFVSIRFINSHIWMAHTVNNIVIVAKIAVAALSAASSLLVVSEPIVSHTRSFYSFMIIVP